MPLCATRQSGGVDVRGGMQREAGFKQAHNRQHGPGSGAPGAAAVASPWTGAARRLTMPTITVQAARRPAGALDALSL